MTTAKTAQRRREPKRETIPTADPSLETALNDNGDLPLQGVAVTYYNNLRLRSCTHLRSPLLYTKLHLIGVGQTLCERFVIEVLRSFRDRGQDGLSHCLFGNQFGNSGEKA